MSASEPRRSLRVAILDRNMVVNPFALGLARALSAVGHEVVVGTAAGARLEGVEAFYPRAGVSGRRIAKSADAPLGLARAVARLRAFDPDVVHYQWTAPIDRLYSLALARAVPRAAVVVTVHRVARSRRLRWSQLPMLARADAAIAFGESIAAGLAAAHPDLTVPVEVVPHGNYADVVAPVSRPAARGRLGIDPSAAVFAFFGQIRPDKGVERLLQAVARLPYAVEVLVAGTVVDRAYRDRLAHLEADLGARVRWIQSHDMLPTETLVDAVCAADATVFPFVSAVQSGSVIFAMTLGSCVIATDTGETAATIGGNGIVVPQADGDALTSALRWVLDNPDGARALGDGARESILGSRSWRTIALDVARVYALARTAKAERRRTGRAAVVPSAAAEAGRHG